MTHPVVWNQPANNILNHVCFTVLLLAGTLSMCSLIFFNDYRLLANCDVQENLFLGFRLPGKNLMCFAKII